MSTQKYMRGDIVMYKRDVCRVVRIGVSEYTQEECYILVPLTQPDGSIKMQVPVSNVAGHLRDLMKPEEIMALIQEVPSIETLASKPANMKSQYLNLMHSNDVRDLIRIIKTSRKRNQDRIANKKRPASVDDEFLRKAEACLFNEIAASMQMSFEESKEFFENELVKITNLSPKKSV